MAGIAEIIERWDSPVARRIAARLDMSPDGCWEARFTRRRGYALIDIGGKTKQVHRVVYEALSGPIPTGLQIDHLCRNRACCNPAHLEAVTPRENTMRGQSFAAKFAKQTHCKNGHPLTKENCRPHKLRLGRRGCITCENAAARKRRRAIAEGASA